LRARLRPTPKIAEFRDELRDALIVRDIRSAIELWLRQPALNFITPDGDLLLSSGLLKIGRREEGAFALGQEIRQLEGALALWTSELVPLAAGLQEKENEIARLDGEIAAGAFRLEELGREIHEIEKKRIAALSEREKSAGTVALLKKELDLLRKDNSALSSASGELRNKISGLEAEEAAQKTRLENEEREFSAHRGRTIEEEKRTIGLRSDIVLLEERLGHTAGQINEIGQRKEALVRKIASLRGEAEAARKDETEAREAAAAIDIRLKTQDEERNSRQAKVSEKEAALLQKRTESEKQDKALAEAREELERKKEERVKWEIAKAEIDRDMVNLEETCWQELKKTLHELKSEKPEIELSDAEIEEHLAEAEEDLQRIKTVNLMAEEEYTGVKERFDFLIRERDDLRQSIDSTQQAIRKIDEESQTQFLAALTAVNKNFQEVFTLLFKGGSAEVKLLDAGQVQESGIEIIAQPPGKKVQNVHLLSGGEKSLTSLAFLFALFRYKPTPFCILDEVDAALDDVNLTRFLDLMKEIKKDTQFIIITHNYKTMEVADYIYGTTMSEPNITKLYSMKLEKQQELVQ
jgi:chromosome segregation protein